MGKTNKRKTASKRKTLSKRKKVNKRKTVNKNKSKSKKNKSYNYDLLNGGGGEINNIKFYIDDVEINNIVVDTGYKNLNDLKTKLLTEPQKKFKCIVEWKHDNGNSSKYKFEINVNSSLPGDEILPAKYSSASNIYISINRISKQDRNTDKPLCLWLISNNENPNIINLAYIRSENKTCFVLESGFESLKIPQGNIIMKLLINLSRLLNYKTIELLDQSNKTCNYGPGNDQSRNLRNFYLLKTGDTYYGSIGFRPNNPENKVFYDNTSKLLKTPIGDLFNIEGINKIKAHYDGINISDFDDSKKSFHEFKKQYIDELLKNLNNPEIKIKFNDFNNKYINQDCKWEKVIYDIIEDKPYLFSEEYINDKSKELVKSVYPTGQYSSGLITSRFEKMALNL